MSPPLNKIIFSEASIVSILTVGIFILDMLTPLGWAVWLLYLLPLTLMLQSSSARNPYYFAAVATVLTVVGWWLSPPGGRDPVETLFNRLMAIGVMWTFTWMMVCQNRTRVHLDSVEAARSEAEASMTGAVQRELQVSRELRLSSLRLQGIVQSAMDAILTVDDQQHVLLFNEAAERMFGCSSKEALGQPLERFIPSRYREAHWQHVERFGQSGVTSRKMGQLGTVFGLRVDGEEFPVEAAISNFTVEGKRFFTVILRDLTDRRQSEEQFRLAVEAAPSGMLMVNQSGRIVLINAQIEELFGYSRDELLGQPVEVLVPEVSRLQHVEHRQKFFSDPRARRMGEGRDLFGLRKNGDEFPVEIGLNPIHTAEGVRVLASVVDITERKRAEEQFRVAVEGSPHGMIMVDESGTILMVNGQIERQFGYSRQELLGQSIEILVPESLRRKHQAHRAEFYQKPEPRRMGAGRELFGVRKDGTLISVEIGLNPIRMAVGIRILASVVDISDRKRIEEQLRRTERIAELGTLASGMAHEIGTPMNVILGRAEYLLQRTNDDILNKGLRTIVAQVERITRVMNQLLAFARRKPVARGALDLRMTINESLEIFEDRLQRHTITIERVFEEACPPVLADADQMSQVVINLVINALHAMPEGGTLRIGIAPHDGMVRLTVADTGHGIPPDLVAKIFDPFFTTKEFGKGTGLGLTVVKGIIEEHQGNIAVESTSGKGTCFSIDLPQYERT
jgi:PAS domain S-box-containing protein